MNLFDRYITRNFLQAYFYCIVGFISIWFIFDISDSISTFLDQHLGLMRVLEFYATQIPQILVILLPVSLLLALLFVLGRMSRANEIVSDVNRRYQPHSRARSSFLSSVSSQPQFVLPLIIPSRRTPKWRESFSSRLTKARRV